MYHRILVPTDGSAVAAAAVDAAVELAETFDAVLHVVHVIEQPGRTPRSEGVTETAAANARAAGLEVTTAVVEETDSIHGTILAYAADHEIDCIVAGTHGRTGLRRLLLGSITELLLRESPIPVFTVHEETVVSRPFERILVPTDGSDCADTAADEAIDLATWSGASIHLVHVLDIGVAGANVGAILASLQGVGEQALETIAERARDAGVAPVETTIVRGIPYWSIDDYVDDHDVDCVVMGTHGRTGYDRLFLGSVTERVVRLADVPVLTIRCPEASIRQNT